MKITNKIMAVLLCMCCVIGLMACNNTQDTPNNNNGKEEKPKVIYGKGIINTEFDTEEIIIANYIIDEKSGADPKGIKDSSDAIQNVLNECAKSGGGTVYLPKGKYLVTRNIQIPSFVALRGDYNDPDNADFNGDYGTIILAKPKAAEVETRNPILGDRDDIYTNFPALFILGGSSAFIGLTVYYPDQKIENVTPYPFVIEIPSFAGQGGHINHHASTVKNATFINAYKGIIAGASASVFSGGYGAAFEQVHIENIKGTFLYQAMQMYIASEAGVVKNINIDNSYWKNAKTLGNVNGDKLDNYTKKYTTGMLLGDLEWLFFNDITIKDVSMGIRIYDSLRRFFTHQVYFIGQFYNLCVENTKTAMRIDNMYPNFGVTITDSYLQGSVYSLNERDKTKSSVKLINTKLIGDVYGDSIYKNADDTKYNQLKNTGELANSKKPTIPCPFAKLYNVCSEPYNADNTAIKDASVAIQKALDDANKNGGGIVYLKSGYYKIEKPLTVYDNTELRGSAGSSSRDQQGMSKGTVLLGFYGYQTSKLFAMNNTALVTVQGNNSGIRGLRFIYPENKPAPRNVEKYKYHTYPVRILGQNNYVAQASIVGVPFGIDINGAKDCIISEVSGTYYEIGVNIQNSENVFLDELIENAAVVSRLGYGTVPSLTKYFLYGWPTDIDGLQYMYSEITRPNLVFFNAENSKNISIVNGSAFGIKTFYKGKNSTAKILSCNSDNCSDFIFKVNGGNLNVVNMFKYNDKTLFYTENAGNVNCFNNLTLHFITNYELDKNIVNNQKTELNKILSSNKNIDDLPLRYKLS